jgi:ribosomal protein RSM22 (predicted rRNA methylase)
MFPMGLSPTIATTSVFLIVDGSLTSGSMARLPYSKKILRATDPSTATAPRRLRRRSSGGIGTGNVSVGTRGDLRDWEIFNRSAKAEDALRLLQYTARGDEVDARVRVASATTVR